HVRDELDDLGNIEDHVGEGRRLANAPVDSCHQARCSGYDRLTDRGTYWTEAVEALGACPLSVHSLQIACRHVAAGDVAEYVVFGPSARHTSSDAANDHAELAFEVHTLARRREHDAPPGL